MQISDLNAYARHAMLFGIQFLREIKKENPHWLGLEKSNTAEFSISEDAVKIVEEKCLEDLQDFLKSRENYEAFTSAVKTGEGLYEETSILGRCAVMELLDPYDCNMNPRFKVVDGTLVPR